MIMKKLVVLLMIAGLLLLSGCPSDDIPTGPISPSDSLLISGTITDTGGEFGNDDFVLSIPEGAFSTDTELDLYETSSVPNYDSTGCTKTFMLEGLPDTLFETVKIRLKYEGALSDSSYIVVGYAISNEGTDSALVVNRYLSCSDSSGYLCADLSGLFGVSYRKEHPSKKAHVRNVRLYIKGVTAMMKAQTRIGHFHLTFPAYCYSMIPYLEEYLEGAYREFGIVRGYEYSMVRPPGGIVNSIKIEVRNFNPAAEKYSKYAHDMTRPPHDPNDIEAEYDFDMIVNERYFTSSHIDEYRSAIYEEFFRIIQEANIKTDQYRDIWFHEASAQWIEGEYEATSPGLSDDFAGNEMAAFSGFYTGTSDFYEHLKHGKGMTAFIEFLMRDQGSYDNLRLIYDKLRTGMGAVDAIISTLEGEPFDWIIEFYKKYLSATFTNSNYDVSASVFTASSNLAGTLNITSATDKEQSFNTSITEGGAKLFKINLSPQTFGDNTVSVDLATVSNDVDLGDLQILVFEYNSGQLTYLTQGLTVKVTHLEDFADNNSDLYVAVVNTSLTSPTYDQTANVTFNTEVKVSPDITLDFTNCSVHVANIDGSYTSYNNSSYNQVFWHDISSLIGSFSGNYYYGFSSSPGEGEIEIWMNTESMEIDSLHVIWGNTGLRREIKAKSIPYDRVENGYYHFQITGDLTCSAIKSISDTKHGDQWFQMQAYDCNSESSIIVTFWR